LDMPPSPDEIWRGIRAFPASLAGMPIYSDDGIAGLSDRFLPSVNFTFTTSDTLATWSIPENGPITTQEENRRNGIIRWYEPVTGRWLSNDPIGISGGLDQYVFCADDPVNAVDPLGLVVFFVHGTWSSGEAAFPNNFRQHVLDFYNDNNERMFEWSGDNCDKERQEAGRRLSLKLRLYRRDHPGEQIRIVAHSHGGNVALIASQFPGVTIDTLVTLGTPIMSAYQPGQGIGVWNNVYSTADRVQTLPSSATRTHDRANNIQLQNFGHSDLHTINAWDAAFPPGQ